MTTNREGLWRWRLRVIKMILKGMTGEADALHQSLSIISPISPSVLWATKPMEPFCVNSLIRKTLTSIVPLHFGGKNISLISTPLCSNRRRAELREGLCLGLDAAGGFRETCEVLCVRMWVEIRDNVTPHNLLPLLTLWERCALKEPTRCSGSHRWLCTGSAGGPSLLVLGQTFVYEHLFALSSVGASCLPVQAKPTGFLLPTVQNWAQFTFSVISRHQPVSTFTAVVSPQD